MTSSYELPGLRGRAAIVTGATRGIGRAVAGQLAAAGALVCVTARDADDVRRTAAELGGVGLAGSVADPAHLRAGHRAGPARVRPDRRRWSTTRRRTSRTARSWTAIRRRGARRSPSTSRHRCGWCRSAWRGWMREHGGAVVNICTEGAGHVGPSVGAYGTSKAALLHLTRQLAGELAPRGTGQLRLPRPRPHRDGTVRVGAGRAGGRRAGCRSGGSGSRRTWRGRWRGWRRTRRSGSPGPTCWWTGARGCGRRRVGVVRGARAAAVRARRRRPTRARPAIAERDVRAGCPRSRRLRVRPRRATGPRVGLLGVEPGSTRGHRTGHTGAAVHRRPVAPRAATG